VLPPIHATQVARPFHSKSWVYEEKIDGWRMLAHKEAGHVRLVSRNGQDHQAVPGPRGRARRPQARHLHA
jgi:ATP-dependent DNA ligase